MVEPGAPGQIPKEHGVPPDAGVPPTRGVPRGKGIPPGHGVPRGKGILPGQGRLPGDEGQLDRGAPGQMDKDAENPWAPPDDGAPPP